MSSFSHAQQKAYWTSIAFYHPGALRYACILHEHENIWFDSYNTKLRYYALRFIIVNHMPNANVRCDVKIAEKERRNSFAAGSSSLLDCSHAPDLFFKKLLGQV